MHKISPPKRQQGAAIIVALFVVALVAAAAVAMMMHFNIDIRRTDLSLRADQAELYAEGSLDWAIDQLNNDWKKQKTSPVTLKTPLQSKTDIVNGYKIESTIEDAQGRFNINNLVSQDYISNFIHLIHATQPDMPLEQINNIIVATRDWISPGNNTELETYYGKQVPAYRAPHRPMVSISELRLVKGVTPELYNSLLPYMIALPVISQINVNNASIPVYMSLSATMSPESAASIMKFVNSKPLTKTDEFMSFDVVKNHRIPSTQITLSSSYFLVKTSVTVDQQQMVIYTLLVRQTVGNKSTLSVLWQTKGTL